MSSSVTPPPVTPTPPTRAVEQLVNRIHACDLSSSLDVSTVLSLLAELERHAATRAARLVVADLLALRLDMEPAAHVLHVALERTLERIVAAMHVADLLALDRQLRPSPWKVPVERSPWDPARSAAVQRLAGSTPSAVVCGLLASHPSGYVREAVVDELRARGVEALPWLLVRSVDWVAPVQARASRGVEELLAGAGSTDLLGAALVAALPLANRLPGFTRVRAAPEGARRPARVCRRERRRHSLSVRHPACPCAKRARSSSRRSASSEARAPCAAAAAGRRS